MKFDDKDKTVENWLKYEDNHTDLDIDNPLDGEKHINRVLQKAASEQGQKDTIMFAFVNIWVTMAELLAPVFANIALKNNQAINPKFKDRTAKNKTTTK